MFVLPLLTLGAWCSLRASAWFVANVSIDDTKGDYATLAAVDYGDGDSWSDAQNCTDSGTGLLCPAAAKCFEQTYHATVIESASASVTFTGK